MRENIFSDTLRVLYVLTCFADILTSFHTHENTHKGKLTNFFLKKYLEIDRDGNLDLKSRKFLRLHSPYYLLPDSLSNM